MLGSQFYSSSVASFHSQSLAEYMVSFVEYHSFGLHGRTRVHTGRRLQKNRRGQIMEGDVTCSSSPSVLFFSYSLSLDTANAGRGVAVGAARGDGGSCLSGARHIQHASGTHSSKAHGIKHWSRPARETSASCPRAGPLHRRDLPLHRLRPDRTGSFSDSAINRPRFQLAIPCLIVSYC